MRSGRAVVTYSRSWCTLAAIRNLGQHGVEVIAGDQYPLTPGGLSRYAVSSFQYPDPDEDPDGFVAALVRAVEDNAPADDTPYVLLPMHREGQLIARHRDRFEPRCRVPLPASEVFERVCSKRWLVRAAARRGIPVPRTWMPEDRAGLERAAREVSYPALVMLPHSVAGAGVETVHTCHELIAAYTRQVEEHRLAGDSLPLIQELAPGDAYCVSALLRRGQVRASVTSRASAALLCTGSAGSPRCEAVRAPRLETCAAGLFGDLQWHGVAEADFRWDGVDEHAAVLVEVRPRFFDGLLHAVASGVNYPWLMFRLAVADDIQAEDLRTPPTRTETPALGLLATIGEIADSEALLMRLHDAWQEVREALDRKGLLPVMLRLFEGLRASLDASVRVNRVQKLLRDHPERFLEIMDSDDPLPVLGVLYLLALFIRQGSIETDLGVNSPTSSCP